MTPMSDSVQIARCARRWLRMLLFATLLAWCYALTGCAAILDSNLASGLEPRLDTPSFDDADLARVLEASAEQGTDGILYVWSPHMPYSVVGLKVMFALQAEYDWQVVALLDPSADQVLAQRVAARMRWNPSTLQRLHSNALFDRGFTLHYPTLAVFSNGVINEAILPGYRSGDGYRSFIHGALLRGTS